MVFSSVLFLFLFLPVVLSAYFLSPGKTRNVILLIASLLFYSWGEDKLVILLLVSAIIDYTCGHIIEKGKKKLGLGISIISNLSILAFFKYFNFAFHNFNYLLNALGIQSDVLQNLPQIALPIGISFYTFQTMSYTIDVYRGHVKANRNFIDFATFVTMFPQLVAGPIVRYADIDKQLRSRHISLDKFAVGTERFIIGLAKKVLLANTFASIADDVFSQNINDLSTVYAWIGIISYSFQIYFDFSGYSDMAIGLGKMFGFDFLENFNYPYISKSIREFWRRWHISLSTWFRDYVYVSLGGNRHSNTRTYANLFIVFTATGLWHGASWSFVIWGLFHGVFLVFERMGLDKKLTALWSPLQHAYTLLIVVVGWVFFRADDLPEAMQYLKTMFLYSDGNPSLVSYFNFYHLHYHSLTFLVLAVIFSLPVRPEIVTRLKSTKSGFSWIYTISLFMLFVLTITYLTADTYNPFIYFRF